MDALKNIEVKMRKEGLGDLAIAAFRQNYQALVTGETGLVSESEIEAVRDLPRLEEVAGNGHPEAGLMAQAAVLKLNGGLGTGMGLDKAKSLITIKDGLTFLDLIARQILHQREVYKCPIPFCLMNSFSTRQDTLEYLGSYPDLGGGLALDFVQSKVPKIDAESLEAVQWPRNESLEWCPPGHGDLYPSLAASGLLEAYLKKGIRYLFVSNADNLGASLDIQILRYFAGKNFSFMMEVAERTASDKKGGHLAIRKSSGRFLLRESAQCPEADNEAFQDTGKHRFFNTNNLWINLEVLQKRLAEAGGFIPLPLIRNSKTVDPKDPSSPKVYQLETAMGAAIEAFEGTGALVVPRTRFAPVKACSDLLVLRSDAYVVQEDWTLKQSEDCPVLPVVKLDESHYKKVSDFEELFAKGVPSLKACTELKVQGRVRFSGDVVCRGKVMVTNLSGEEKTLSSGTYSSEVLL